MTRPVTVLVLCWNRWDLTSACLASIRRHGIPDNAEVLVVDNGSTDETRERLPEVDWVRTLRNTENLGFVRGNNSGLSATPPDRDVILLNNDVEILGPGWVEQLQKSAYAADDVGVVGCRLVLPDGKLLHAGTYILPETFWGQQIGSLETDVNQFAGDRDVQGIVFACAYLKRQTIDAIGGLSEAYESYFEDTDYCLRARDAGYRTVCCGAVTMLHREHGSTEEEPGMFDRVFERSRAEFSRRWRDTLEEHDGAVHWQSVMNFSHGYAGTSRDIVRELERLGVRVTYEYVYGPGTPVNLPEPENSGDYWLNVVRSRPVPRTPDVSVVYGQGDVFERSRGRYRVGFTMLEVDGFPEEWVRQANQLDEVWVPSGANRDALIRCGLRTPILTMPLGVDTERFHPGARALPNPNGDFVFLASFEWGERKAPELLLRAFNDTFQRSEPVALLCKVMNRDPGVNVRRSIEGLRLRAAGGRIAFLHNRDFPYHELPLLYRSADCFVSAGHGEGWDMPLMEAMACGLPAIATDWGAHQEFVHDAIAYPLQTLGTTQAEAKCPYYDGFSWAAPDPEHLRTLLRSIYENRDEARQKGARAAAEVADRWTSRRTAERIRARLAEIREGVAPMRSSRAPAPRSERPCIAIDVSRAVGDQISGVGRHAWNVALALSRHGPEDLEYLLLPGFGSFVMPEYGERFHLDVPAGQAHMSVYRGALPAYADRARRVPRVNLIHSTAHMAPAEADVPMLFTVHDLSFVTHPHFHTRENIDLCRASLDAADRAGGLFLAVSESTRRDLIEYGIDGARIRNVGNAYDERSLAPSSVASIARTRHKYGLPEEYFLFLASLEPRKNLATVLDALERQKDGVPLVVAGAAGWQNRELHDRMAALGDRVIPIGYVAQEDVAAVYSGARALVYPSIYEGFGLPLLEAMACGTPTITSRVSSMPEVVGEAGVLLDDPLDTEALAAALARLALDDDERKRLAERSLEQAARFSIERFAERVVGVYREVLPPAQG